MNKSSLWIRSWTLGLILATTAALAWSMRPAHQPSHYEQSVDLENLIPTTFAGWHTDIKNASDNEAEPIYIQRNKLYTQTISRSYTDQHNIKIMLSIAYGSNQLNDRLQAHRPEYCYRAQGFNLMQINDSEIQTAQGSLRVRRLFTKRRQRSEPNTYWMTIGDQQLLPGIQRKLAQLRYGLSGEIPDGMLIRVSSLNNDPDSAYALHDQFIRDLLLAMKKSDRRMLIGQVGVQGNY